FPHLQPMPALRRRVRHEPTGATPLEQVRHPHFLAAELVRTVRENMDRQVELAMIHRLPNIGFTHLSGGSLEQGSHFDRPQPVRPVTEPYALTACLRAARQVQDRPGRGDVADDRLPRREKTGHDLHPPTSDVERVRRRASRDAARMASASLRASIFSMTTKGPPPFCARSDTRSVWRVIADHCDGLRIASGLPVSLRVNVTPGCSQPPWSYQPFCSQNALAASGSP